MHVDPSTLSVSELLDWYHRIESVLFERKVIRTGHVVADYCEWLAARALSLTLAPPITKGYDASDSLGRRYQVKGRKAFRGHGRRINGSGPVTPASFDFLVIVLLKADFSVYRAAVAPVEAVAEWPLKFNNISWTFRATDDLLQRPDVLDVLPEFRRVAGEL